MSELSTLEARLDAALSYIQGAVERGVLNGSDSEGDGADLSALRAENTQLSQSLATLQAQRERDVADLDDLIERLKPLVEEKD